MRSKLRQVADALLPRPAELQDLRSRLRRAHEAIEFWKARSRNRKKTVDRLKKMVDDMKDRVQEVHTHAEVRKRAELSTAVLEQILPLRVRERPTDSSDLEIARSRERRLLEASAAYRSTVDDDAARAVRLTRMELQGVPWWLPRDEATAGRADKLRLQGFPLRAILQTRELALGGIMLDLGANVGRTSITRVLLGDVRAVYAAEPEPVNYACLVQNVVEHRLRGFVLPDQVAIGAARGEVQLQRSTHIGGHRVLTGAAPRRADVQTVAVALWPIDEWMLRLGVEPESVSFVKVDTQGSEVNVLRGATALLARSHVAWQVEVDPGLLTRAGATVTELLTLLESHFTHFIDIGTSEAGPRMQSTRDLRDALAYVGTEQSKTDLVLYNAAR